MGESPIGRTYHTGDTLSISLAYETDGCTSFGGSFDGYHSPGTPRYGYYCPNGCGPRLRSLFLRIDQQPITLQTGVVTLTAAPGPFPPSSNYDPPDLEGFTLCFIDIAFGDGQFGGVSINTRIGEWCDAVGAPIQ